MNDYLFSIAVDQPRKPDGTRAWSKPRPAPQIRPHFADPKDHKRLAEANARLLDYLRRHGPTTGPDLVPVAGMRYGGRLFEVNAWLRNNTGERIGKRRTDTPGAWLYWVEKQNAAGEWEVVTQ